MDENRDHTVRTRETADEFAADLDDAGEYVPPGYEVTHAPDDTGDGAADERPGRRAPGEGDEHARAAAGNALDAVLDRLDGADAAVVVVAGESGAGRSRLLAEVGRELREQGEAPVRYVRGTDDGAPPSVADGTVLCVDDAGRMADPDRFLGLAAEGDVRVVATARPVHAGSLTAGGLPDDVPRHELALDPLDAGGTVDLLAADDVPADRARAIHGVTGGNPFLSRRAARAGVDPSEADDASGAVADAIEALLPDGDEFPADATAARSLLSTVAVLGTADPTATDTPELASFDDPTDRRRALDALRDAGLLAAVDAPADGTAYALRSGVVAEYLRYRALVDESGVYGAAIDGRLATDAPGIARGLVELRRSPLVRTGAVDIESVRVRPLLEDLAAGVVDADAPLADVLRVATLVALVAPGVVPYEELAARYESAEPSAAHAGHLFRFATVLYRHAAATAADEYDLPLSPATLLSHARTWLDRLNGLAIDRPDDAALQSRLAHALRDAAAYEAAAGRFDGAATCLDRLDVLAGDNPESDEVGLTFATALGDTASAAGTAGRVDDLGTHVDRLSTFAADHPDHAGVRRALATALVNATNYEGDAGRFDALASRVDRLSGLADANPESDEVQHRFAQGLLNATSAESGAGRFEDADARLAQLADLADANPESDEIRHRFAQALLSVVDREAGNGRFEDLDARLSRLSALVADHPDEADLRRRLAQALFAIVDSETDAGRFEAVSARVDRLVDLAVANPDDGAVQVSATGGCFVALRGLVTAGEYEAASEAVDALGTLADRPSGFQVGSKGADVKELSTETGEQLLRDGRMDLFERFAAALAEGLSDGRWRSISSDLIMTADSLVGEGTIPMDEYKRVVEWCDV
ncbi:MAG: hypothetical protein ABEH78_07560 [Haloferacaceae archaeon]